MIRTDIAVMLTTLLLSIWLWYLYELYQAWGWKPSRKKLLRLLRFRTPHDCPYCGGQHLGRCARVVASKPLPIPWSQVKSPRGRKKRIKTDGHACPNGECGYCGIRNPKIHALIGYGHHGKGERIQDFFCQACQKKVTSRWGTIMYRLKTTTKRVSEVMTALAEGLDLSAAVHVFGHGEGTMRCWLTRSGEHSQRLHDEHLQDLRLGHIQLDELMVQIKGRGRDVWLWVAMDATTKLMPVLQLGPRKQEVAYAVVHTLAAMLAPGCTPAFTSDGLNMYFYSLTAHFGHWQESPDGHKPQWVVSPDLVYAQLKKIRSWRRLVGTEQRMLCGTREMLTERLHACNLRATIQTAFVERVNLTLRQSIAGLARRTWSIHIAPSELETHIRWYQAYYHFCRPHESLRMKYQIANANGEQITRFRSRTPMIAAGLARHRWSVQELLLHPLPAGV